MRWLVPVRVPAACEDEIWTQRGVGGGRQFMHGAEDWVSKDEEVKKEREK